MVEGRESYFLGVWDLRLWKERDKVGSNKGDIFSEKGLEKGYYKI